ncbi:DP-EP family protein [Shewanella benthica]|uniref:DP-EP family protein n=1 Tax=Shewanella benthica TaxID=43661 RepID=UPI00187AD300|nr:DP-EP family protein [Shewanella benthica]MBE7213601.1 DP-EP family protein [Shewanella benthica]MCL1060871.1 DP-EP family protein [Shewanella benthica]
MTSQSLPQGPRVDVSISYNEATKIHEFLYFDETGQPTDGNVVVDKGETVVYRLKDSPDYRFIGAGFVTPCDGVIESVSVIEDGQQLVLQDEDSVVGKTVFQLIIQCPQSPNWLLSPDPQVINRNTL